MEHARQKSCGSVGMGKKSQSLRARIHMAASVWPLLIVEERRIGGLDDAGRCVVMEGASYRNGNEFPMAMCMVGRAHASPADVIS
jgi:hypothetical protein